MGDLFDIGKAGLALTKVAWLLQGKILPTSALRVTLAGTLLLKK